MEIETVAYCEIKTSLRFKSEIKTSHELDLEKLLNTSGSLFSPI